MRSGPQFERALCDLIIMVAPFAPHFASELWRGVTSAPNRLNNYDWVRRTSGIGANVPRVFGVILSDEAVEKLRTAPHP